MLNSKIGITAISCISSLHNFPYSVWNSYQKDKTCFARLTHLENNLGAKIHLTNQQLYDSLKVKSKMYEKADRTVLLALKCVEELKQNAEINPQIGVNISSSRGATELWEFYHHQSLTNEKMSSLASPVTTLGNISSLVGNYLSNNGINFSHSMTCSSSLISILNGIAWLEASFCKQMLVGGSEAPLTQFTINQMNALKIYSKRYDENFACLAGLFNKTENSMILGEGAGVCLLEKNPKQEKVLAYIKAIGFGSETITHWVSLSEEADNLQLAINQVFQQIDKNEIDVIISHTPGTSKGDDAELFALHKLFNENPPAILNNKWKIGHTFGASGILSLELALLILQHQELPYFPFTNYNQPKKIRNILINSMGFGGNAISIVVGKN